MKTRYSSRLISSQNPSRLLDVLSEYAIVALQDFDSEIPSASLRDFHWDGFS